MQSNDEHFVALNEKRAQLKGDAIMAAFLLESGWSLHLFSNRKYPPLLTSAQHVGSKMSGTYVSYDTVLDLQQLGLLKKYVEISTVAGKHAIYRWITDPRN